MSVKDNTYKFAMARFLLDYSNRYDKLHIDYSTIAAYFLKYYWTQVCKLKMKHASQRNKQPEIVTIIEREFTKPYYPQTFNKIKVKEPKKISRCVAQIEKKCFHNVVWRFQKVKVNKSVESKLFFDYKIARVVNSNKKYVDLDYGIYLNPNAMQFLKKFNVLLMRSVILEWAKFLESRNVGLPKVILKTDGEKIPRGNLTKYRQLLEPFFPDCFYCGCSLSSDKRQTHVEHVIPFDYIAEDDIWNLTLVCQKCNLKKLGALPPKDYLKKLIIRNKEYSVQIPELEKSLVRLDMDFEKTIRRHYDNAHTQGYMIVKKFL